VPDQKRRLCTSSSSKREPLTCRAGRLWRVKMAGGVGVPLADSAGSSSDSLRPRAAFCGRR
jgi:hypothetical protein